MSAMFGNSGGAATDRTSQLASFGTLADLMYYGSMNPAGKGQQAQGQGGLDTAQNFFSTLLQGDPTKTAEMLAPQTKQIQSQANERTKTNAEFGNRSGGTNASNQQIQDNSTSSVNNLIATLTGQAAGGLTDVSKAMESFGLGTLGLANNSATSLASLSGQDKVNQQQINQGIGQDIGQLFSTLALGMA